MSTRRLPLVLFIHGFGSSAKCWNRLLSMLRADATVAAAYEFATWQYPTKWIEMNVLGRIPGLAELGRGLADEIDSPQYRNRDVLLVGHSQGGLIIQSFFARAVEKGEAYRLRNIRQAIFFATPTEGSTTALNLRVLASTLFSNPQELSLRVLNPDVAEMKSIVRNRIVEADDDTDGSRRIPIHAFCGMQDDIVPEASARGIFDNLHSVPGTHSTIIQPPTIHDPRYREFVEILLEPGGHKHKFDVAQYEVEIAIAPRDREIIRTAILQKPVLKFDNYATVKRTVRFAASNRCRDTYTIRYATRSGGYVIGHTSHPNQVPAAEMGRWQDTGESYQFDFKPLPGEEYCLNVEVFQGYGEGQRNIHFHLGRPARYERMTFDLDLSLFMAAGHVLTHTPRLYLEPHDRGHSDLCTERKARSPLEVFSESGDGRFTWVLEAIEDGVVDILWDFLPIPSAQPLGTQRSIPV